MTTSRIKTDPICRGCSFNIRCQTQKDMRERHGYPSKMQEAIWSAHADGFLTTEEAEKAIQTYTEDYNAAPLE
jgi:hypothetical protein